MFRCLGGALAALGLLAACGSSTDCTDGACGEAAGGSGGVGGASPTSTSRLGGACDAVVSSYAVEGFTHVPVCSPVEYGSDPPSSGNHYPEWAAYRVYTDPIPLGFLVHNLEHGAVVLVYNCPQGCDDDVSAAAAFVNGYAPDPLCVSPVRNRLILVPDPSLRGARFAAMAWGWTLRASCFDAGAFGAFGAAHYGRGREALCDEGVDFSTSPATCSVVDT